MNLTSTARGLIKSTILVSLLFCYPANIFSASLEENKEALNTIADFSDRLCKDIPLVGNGDNLELSGSAKAELKGIVKKLVDLGVDGAVKYQTTEYEGLLQKDLVGAIKNETNCRLQIWNDLKDKLVSKSPPRLDKPVTFNGSNEELVSFVGWYGDGSFSYTGGSCKGCPDLETYKGTGALRPEVLVADSKYVNRLDFLRDKVTIDTQSADSIKSGSNTLFKGIEHAIVKVDGTRNNFYGGMTSYCWSGTHQACVANASNKKSMMQFVTYRLNQHSYKIRATKSNGETFLIDLPKVAY